MENSYERATGKMTELILEKKEERVVDCWAANAPIPAVGGEEIKENYTIAISYANVARTQLRNAIFYWFISHFYSWLYFVLKWPFFVFKERLKILFVGVWDRARGKNAGENEGDIMMPHILRL